MHGALDKVRRLRVKHYNYTDNFLMHTRRSHVSNVGLIAQEVQEVIPAAVHTLGVKKLYRFDEGLRKHVLLEEIDNFLQLDKDVLLMHALAAVQELAQQVEALASQQ